MSRFPRSFLAPALLALLLPACGMEQEPLSPVETSLEVSQIGETCVSGDLREDILQLFPREGAVRLVATIQCVLTLRASERGLEDRAVQRALRFLEWTLEQNDNGSLLDPDPSAEEKIVELFDEIFSLINFESPILDPDLIVNGEYAFGTLTPGGSPLITNSGHAGIDDGGGLLGPVSVFIVQIPAGENGLAPSSASHPCPAGVDSSFDCYAPFFDYTVVPASNVNPDIGLQVGQCNVSPGSVEVQLLSPEGFLPEDDAPSGIDCSDVGEGEQARMTGWRGLAWTTLKPLAPVFGAKPAFAGKNPVGGRISAFSPVAAADPTSGNGEPPPPPPPGNDIVVFNDVNVFQLLTDPDNVRLVQNLVTFTAAGKPRDDGDQVWVDCRDSAFTCPTNTVLESTIEGEGKNFVAITQGSLDDLPADVKVLFLWLPRFEYTNAEVNAFKEFASEGGRIVFVGEHEGFYGSFIPAQNRLLERLGAVLRNTGNLVDCGFVTLPASSIRPHQITVGVETLSIACSSVIVPGPGDFPLYVDSSGTQVLSGVATIDTTPIPEEIVGQGARTRPLPVSPPTHDPEGNPIGGSR